MVGQKRALENDRSACRMGEIRQTPAMSNLTRSFSEREFYLAEFRGRSIGIAWPADEPERAEPLARVIDELVANGSRVVLLTPQPSLFEIAGVDEPVSMRDEHFAPQLWRALRGTGRAGLSVSKDDFEADCCEAAVSLRLAKVVWIRSVAPIERTRGEGRISVVDLAHLAPLLGSGPPGGDRSVEPRTSESSSRTGDPSAGVPEVDDVHALRVRADGEAMLRAIRCLIEGGVPSVNVCPAEDLERELFTYAGAGMFFTKNRYAEVRRLALDDFDLAHALIERGEADGFLAPRDRRARDDVLTHGVGVFIEGRYLAGIGAILPHPAPDASNGSESAAEIAALFALTRYVGEGVGSQIVRFAIDRARQQKLAYLFSCTTSERVEQFFARLGFVRVERSRVPPEKWRDYDPERIERVRCMRFEIESGDDART